MRLNLDNNLSDIIISLLINKKIVSLIKIFVYIFDKIYHFEFYSEINLPFLLKNKSCKFGQVVHFDISNSISPIPELQPSLF